MKQGKTEKWAGILFSVAVGAAAGFLIGHFLGKIWERDVSIGNKLIFTGFALLGIAAAYYIQIVIHEAGHLIAGLLGGYQFSSFRIASFMFITQEGKLQLKRLTIAGTGGQCIMLPPKRGETKGACLFYNMGGPLLNLLTAPLFAAGYFLSGKEGIVGSFCFILATAGIGLGLLNGLPLRFGGTGNDGRNALEMSRDPNALRAFQDQMRIYEGVSKGIRLKEMPEHYFYLPKPEEITGSMVAAMAVFYENRLMEEHRFSETTELIDRLTEKPEAFSGIHYHMLICDRIYCELIGNGRKDKVEELYTKEYVKFTAQMKRFPSVLRTEYAKALLLEGDAEKAEEIRADFEKAAAVYPHPSEMEGERELIEIAGKKWEDESWNSKSEI